MQLKVQKYKLSMFVLVCCTYMNIKHMRGLKRIYNQSASEGVVETWTGLFKKTSPKQSQQYVLNTKISKCESTVRI